MTNWRPARALAAAILLAAAGIAGAQTTEKPPSPAPKKEEPPRKRPRVVSDLSGFELLDPEQLKDKPMVAGATRVLGARAPVILAPRLARLHGTSPVFAWQHEGKRFAFVLWDEAGTELHAAEVEGTRYVWPSGAPRLADGQTYLWSVRLAEPAAAPAATAGVVVVTPAERRQIDEALAGAKARDPYDAALARGQAFVAERVWYDAIDVYSDLIARFPDRAEAYERRATLYAQIPALQGQADEDFARADQLTSSRR